MSGGIDCCSREEGSKEKPKEVRRVSKKTKRANCVPKTGAVWHLSAEEATLAKKPRYNGYACGHGAHGDAKYNRAKQKRVWKSAIRQEVSIRLERNASRSFIFVVDWVRFWPISSYCHDQLFVHATIIRWFDCRRPFYFGWGKLGVDKEKEPRRALVRVELPPPWRPKEAF